ncbi:hypothetical protein ABPG75_004802 [Micractinium tetrahymenae]
MSPARAAFSWVPKADLWPLFSVCGLAVAFCGYSSYRHLAKNPEVLISRQGERANGAGEKMTLEGAASYKPSFFRNLALQRYTPGAVSPHLSLAVCGFVWHCSSFCRNLALQRYTPGAVSCRASLAPWLHILACAAAGTLPCTSTRHPASHLHSPKLHRCGSLRLPCPSGLATPPCRSAPT